MRDLTIPELGPKRKLLAAAEKLFAEKGFDLVSVRDVSEAAKMNVAAVNYHFGSRAALLATVILHHVTPLQEQQLKRLNEAERRANGDVISIEGILHAMIQPIISNPHAIKLSQNIHYQLVSRIFTDNGASLSLSQREVYLRVNDRFKSSLETVLPTVDPKNLAIRFHFIQGALAHLLLRVESLAPKLTMEQVFHQFVAFAAAGLRLSETTEAVPPPLAEESPQAVFNF